jgi:hypothetical protein
MLLGQRALQIYKHYLKKVHNHPQQHMSATEADWQILTEQVKSLSQIEEKQKKDKKDEKDEKEWKRICTEIVKKIVLMWRQNMDMQEDFPESCMKAVFETNWPSSLKAQVHSAWLVWRQHESNMHGKQILDVMGDGSCFYQCLFYLLMWILPVPLVREMTGVDWIKKYVEKTLFDEKSKTLKPKYAYLEQKIMTEEDGFVMPKEWLSHDDRGSSSGQQQPRDSYRSALVKGQKDGVYDKLMRLMGWKGRLFARGEFATRAVFLACAAAFDVQILVYRVNTIDEPCDLQSSARPMNDTDERKSFKYCGVPVLCMMYLGRSSHFNIVSNYPLLDGVVQQPNSDKNYGFTGQDVQSEIVAVQVQNKMVEVVDMCMRCKKLIL